FGRVRNDAAFVQYTDRLLKRDRQSQNGSPATTFSGWTVVGVLRTCCLAGFLAAFLRGFPGNLFLLFRFLLCLLLRSDFLRGDFLRCCAACRAVAGRLLFTSPSPLRSGRQQF